MIRLYTGYDAREAVGLHAFAQSLWQTSPGVSFTPLSGEQGDGSNAFTYERFRIPELCDWSGWALFVDGADMLLRSNIAELWELKDRQYAVQVVKHDYRTKHKTKYIGTELESANGDYPRKNWSSVMLINCGHVSHFNNRHLVREALAAKDGAVLHRFAWLRDAEIGALSEEWNWLADEYGENESAKLLHWTAGIPGFSHYVDAPHSAEWHASLKSAMRGAA